MTSRPDWVSLDVLVEAQLDDARRVSTPEPTYILGRPLDCSRRELEDSVRHLNFSAPRYLPDDPHAEPPQLVTELRAHGIETTVETLSSLPLRIVLDDEVERRLGRTAPP